MLTFSLVDDDIQNALLDSLGFGNIDLISRLVTNRKTIVDTVMANVCRSSATISGVLHLTRFLHSGP
jgi:hypothetical protein